MIVCPNCSHQNPEGAQVCEACFTPLPSLTSCPNCGSPVQTDATFCGQCGFNLKPAVTEASAELGEPQNENAAPPVEIPELVPPDPLVQPEPLIAAPSPVAPIPEAAEEPEPPASPSPAPISSNASTQIQQQNVSLLHLQTNQVLEIPEHLTVIHIGKQNDRIPPDIDVSGFPNSDIVSRIHADIRVEGDAYYIEDVGSSNGTYVNSKALPVGNRHRLRPGDRVSLGKNDLVTFLFQIS